MTESHGAAYGMWLQKDKKNVKWRDEMYDPSQKNELALEHPKLEQATTFRIHI